jgi:hypothetical protein
MECYKCYHIVLYIIKIHELEISGLEPLTSATG